MVALGRQTGPLFEVRSTRISWLWRKKMVAGTHILSEGVPAFSTSLFNAGVLDAAGQTFVWLIIFFFASAGASAAFLTGSEISRSRSRSGVRPSRCSLASRRSSAPRPSALRRADRQGTSPTGLGYIIFGVVMMLGALVEIAIWTEAEDKALEDVARPLSRGRSVATYPSMGLRRTTSKCGLEIGRFYHVEAEVTSLASTNGPSVAVSPRNDAVCRAAINTEP